jgi:hypothetical protein
MVRARTIPIGKPTCRYARYVHDRSGWQEPAYVLASVITDVVISSLSGVTAGPELSPRSAAAPQVGMMEILDSRMGGLRLSPEP